MSQFESIMEILSSTRSVRNYESRPVGRDLLESLVRAGTYASNPRNTQPWRFIVVDDPAIIAKLGDYLVPESPNWTRSFLVSKTPCEQRFTSPEHIYCGTSEHHPRSSSSAVRNVTSGQGSILAKPC